MIRTTSAVVGLAVLAAVTVEGRNASTAEAVGTTAKCIYQPAFVNGRVIVNLEVVAGDWDMCAWTGDWSKADYGPYDPLADCQGVEHERLIESSSEMNGDESFKLEGLRGVSVCVVAYPNGATPKGSYSGPSFEALDAFGTLGIRSPAFPAAAPSTQSAIPVSQCDFSWIPQADLDAKRVRPGSYFDFAPSYPGGTRDGYQYRRLFYAPDTRPTATVGIYIDDCTWGTFGAELIDRGYRCTHEYTRSDGKYWLLSLRDCPVSAGVSEGERDVAADTTTTGVAMVGGMVAGSVDPAGDLDWFAVELEADTAYLIDVRADSDGDPVDTILLSIRDSAGAAIAGTEAGGGGLGTDARFHFTPTVTGTYFIEVGGENSTTGNYQLSVDDDDFAADAATSGVVLLDNGTGTATGNIETANDEDWFRVALEDGVTYRIVVEVDGAASLVAPALAVVAPVFAADTLVHEVGSGGWLRTRFTANADGDHYLSITSAQGDDTGQYGVTVTADDGTDDGRGDGNGDGDDGDGDGDGDGDDGDGEPKHPDLVTELRSVTGNASTGVFELWTVVINRGGADAPATTLRYYRSTDSVISTQDTEVAAVAVEALAASATLEQRHSLSAPPDDYSDYHYGVCVDSVALESNTANNCSASGPFQRSRPDLVVNDPGTSDDTPNAGQEFTLSATVENVRGGYAAETTLRFYRSDDATISTSDTEVGTAAVSALRPFEDVLLSIMLNAPSTSGTYYYGACVDALEIEADASNNCSMSHEVTVPIPKPDLTTGQMSLSHPPAVEPGDPVTLRIKVVNVGAKSSAATTMRFYRSDDATISTSDTELGTTDVPALDPDGESWPRIDFKAIAEPGAYHYGGCIDAVSGEADTANNCSRATKLSAAGHALE